MPNMNHQQEISYTSAHFPAMNHLPMFPTTTGHQLFYHPIDVHQQPRIVVVGNPYQQQPQTQTTQSSPQHPQEQPPLAITGKPSTHLHQQQQQQQQQLHHQQPQQHQKMQRSQQQQKSNKQQNFVQQRQQQQLQTQEQQTQTIITKKQLKHFIEGQWIIETSKPFTETVKPKKVNKKKLKHAAALSRTSPGPLTIEDTTYIASTTITTNSNNTTNNNVTTTNHTNEQTANDISKIRAKMPTWSVQDVVKFIESHEDIRGYASRFAEDDVDGKALLLMIDRNLNLQMLTSMFKHGPAMKIEAALSKYKQE